MEAMAEEYLVTEGQKKRFLTHVEKPADENTCWLWTGFIEKRGVLRDTANFR
jgi:hypothetical protein